MPAIVELQNQVISLPGVQAFIKSKQYFPLSGAKYVAQVRRATTTEYTSLTSFSCYYHVE